MTNPSEHGRSTRGWRSIRIADMVYPKKTVVLAAWLAILSPAAYGTDLVESYQLALQNDPRINAAEAARFAVGEAKPQSRAQLLPNINFQAEGATNTRETTRSGGFPLPRTESFSATGYSLNITQPVYRHELIVGLRQADARVAQAEADYQAAEQELVLRVAERYFNVLAAMDNLEFARAEKKAVGRQLEQAKQRFEVGLIAITDVHEAQARYDLTVAEEIRVENQLADARDALREITNQPAKALLPLQDEIPLVAPAPADVEEWVQLAGKQNLQIVSARYGTEIAREEISRQRAGHYPTLDLVASRSNSDVNSRFGSDSETDTIGLELNLPIFEGGLVNSRTREARYRFDEAKQNLIEQRRTALRQTRDAYLGVLAGISRVKALKQAVISNEKALEATNAGFEVGTRTIVDVLLSQRELFRAQRDYANSRYEYILETLRLKQAAGILADTDIKAINQWLERSP